MRKGILTVVAAVIVVAALLFFVGRVEHEPAPPTAPPQLEGAWFVKYASDPNPYLDVAFFPADDKRIQRVITDLSGPEQVYRNIELAFNPEDGEWQKVCDFLPDELPGGIWWVSRVEAFGEEGSFGAQFANDPHEDKPWLNAFYATEPGEAKICVQTFPLDPAGPVDMVMEAYHADDPERWFAYCDAPDVEEVHPRLAFPTTAGETYLIRLRSLIGATGGYVVYISRDGFANAVPEAKKSETSYEPNNTKDQATSIELGQSQIHDLSDTDDEDWLAVSIPPENQ